MLWWKVNQKMKCNEQTVILIFVSCMKKLHWNYTKNSFGVMQQHRTTQLGECLCGPVGAFLVGGIRS